MMKRLNTTIVAEIEDLHSVLRELTEDKHIPLTEITIVPLHHGFFIAWME